MGLCVGASLDFLGGKARRAPVWVQRARLEWLHRLVQEPGRMWRRYLVEGPKVFLLWQRWRQTQRELRVLDRSFAWAVEPGEVKLMAPPSLYMWTPLLPS